MKIWILSLALGLVAGGIYATLGIHSPAPPVIALLGLFGMLVGEQLIPITRRLMSREPLTLAWFRHECVPKISGTPPVGQCVSEPRHTPAFEIMCQRNDRMQLPQRIAIVDDEPAVRSGLSNLLQSDGYSTRVYESAEAYLAEKNALIESSLIIIDIKLKGMSGFELYEKIKTFPLPPPVIFISGHGDENMQRFAIHLGAVAFLRKPIDIDVLLKHLQHAVRPEKNNASEP